VVSYFTVPFWQTSGTSGWSGVSDKTVAEHDTFFPPCEHVQLWVLSLTWSVAGKGVPDKHKFDDKNVPALKLPLLFDPHFGFGEQFSESAVVSPNPYPPYLLSTTFHSHFLHSELNIPYWLTLILLPGQTAFSSGGSFLQSNPGIPVLLQYSESHWT